MIVPQEATDDLGMSSKATARFLRYSLVLRYREASEPRIFLRFWRLFIIGALTNWSSIIILFNFVRKSRPPVLNDKSVGKNSMAVIAWWGTRVAVQGSNFRLYLETA
jgi:hypothetical protein